VAILEDTKIARRGFQGRLATRVLCGSRGAE